MSQVQMRTYPRYIKTGVELMAKNMRIGVRGAVNLPDGETFTNDSARQVFTACETALQKTDKRISKLLAFFVIFGVIFFCLFKIGTRMDTLNVLDAEITELESRYVELCKQTETEQVEVDKVLDSSYICKRASQELGMIRAVDDITVIQISAPLTRPAVSSTAGLYAGAGGI